MAQYIDKEAIMNVIDSLLTENQILSTDVEDLQDKRLFNARENILLICKDEINSLTTKEVNFG